ncbi:RDD family protein [Spirilliplanes yamanashiensis]|uniref:RDD family protein n=1 Tax=Spirilliplanes yamanashiensis TaxID=42233 RepID=UPI001951CC53|nr:RDD family protein [Spirilliplanes yamanashiensis]MDP9814529.1 putative RDD family membrane protein YckC [Spirilliplanes yamanashiensis]
MTYPPPAHPPAYPPPHYWAPPPPPVAPDGRLLADFGDRLVARIIDVAILTGVAMVVMLPVVGLVIWQTVQNPPEPGASLLDVVGPWLLMYAGLTLLAFAVSYLYEVEYCFRQGGRTVGKRVMKLRIVPLRPGAVYHRGFAVKRWLIMDVVSAFLPGFTYVDGLYQLGDKPYRQCLHDKYATTVVVKDPA